MKHIFLIFLFLSSTARANAWEWQGKHCKEWTITMSMADYMRAIRVLGYPSKEHQTMCGTAYLVKDTYLLVESLDACRCLELQYKVLTGTFWKKD